MLVINREVLFENYDHYLNKNFLSPSQLSLLQQIHQTQQVPADEILNQHFNRKIILQSSSGSQHQPLFIPRTRADILDITERVLQFYLYHYRLPPKRVALIGGISHSQASILLRNSNIVMQNFHYSELAEVDQFDPEVLSCYPSVIRELTANKNFAFKSLCAIKLGGERIFKSDLQKIFQRFNDVVVIEQFGSTELPACALRCFDKPDINLGYTLQDKRFAYWQPKDAGWQRFIVKDNYPGRVLSFNDYFDSGDEAYWREGEIYEFRRQQDRFYSYYTKLDDLLANCISLQFDVTTHEFRYLGDLPWSTICLGSQVFKASRKPLLRLPRSNKLPLFIYT